MRVLYFNEGKYLVFDVPNAFLLEMVDFGRIFSPEDWKQPEIDDDSESDHALSLYKKFMAEADYVSGDPYTLQDVYVSFLNGMNHAPEEATEDIRKLFSEPLDGEDYAVFGAMKEAGSTLNHFSISTMDKDEFEEQAALYEIFRKAEEAGPVGHA